MYMYIAMCVCKYMYTQWGFSCVFRLTHTKCLLFTVGDSNQDSTGEGEEETVNVGAIAAGTVVVGLIFCAAVVVTIILVVLLIALKSKPKHVPVSTDE